jgi:hypothetical protein
MPNINALFLKYNFRKLPANAAPGDRRSRRRLRPDFTPEPMDGPDTAHRTAGKPPKLLERNGRSGRI